MELGLPDGERFAFEFPVYIPMRHGGGNLYAPEPIWYPPNAKSIPIYTDADLAQTGMAAQSFTDLTPLQVENETMLRQVVVNFERAGATHLAIDVCTIPGRPGRFIVPISIAFGRHASE